MKLIKKPEAILLMELVAKADVRLVYPSPVENGPDFEAKGLVPHKIYSLEDNTVIAEYNYESESVNLEGLLLYKGHQIVSLVLIPENLDEYTWVMWELEGEISNYDGKVVIPTKSYTVCSGQESKFIDSLLPDYRKAANKKLQTVDFKKSLEQRLKQRQQ